MNGMGSPWPEKVAQPRPASTRNDSASGPEQHLADRATRLIANCILPLWDLDLAIAELRRVNDAGCKVICFPENPTAFGQPSKRAIHIWSPQSRWLSVPCSEPQNAPRFSRRFASAMRADAS